MGPGYAPEFCMRKDSRLVLRGASASQTRFSRTNGATIDKHVTTDTDTPISCSDFFTLSNHTTE